MLLNNNFQNPKSKSSSKTLISDIDTNSSDKDSYPEVFRKETRMQTLGKSFGLTDAQLSNLSKLVEPTIRLRQSMSDFFSFLVKVFYPFQILSHVPNYKLSIALCWNPFETEAWPNRRRFSVCGYRSVLCRCY